LLDINAAYWMLVFLGPALLMSHTGVLIALMGHKANTTAWNGLAWVLCLLSTGNL